MSLVRQEDEALSQRFSDLITKQNGVFEFNIDLLVQLLDESQKWGKSQQNLYDSEKLELVLKNALLNQNLLKEEENDLINFLSEYELPASTFGYQETQYGRLNKLTDEQRKQQNDLSAKRNILSTIIRKAIDIIPECKQQQQQQQQQQQEFDTALDKLEKATKANNQNSELKAAGRQVHSAVKKAKDKGMIAPKDFPKLTKYVQGTTAVIKDLTDPEKINEHAKNTEEAIGTNRQWGKLIGGAMLGFLGVALVAVSVAVAVATFGGSTPLSAAGLALGGSMVAAGITVGVAAVAGLSLATTAGIFADRARKGDIAVAGERVLSEAKKIDYLEKKIDSGVSKLSMEILIKLNNELNPGVVLLEEEIKSQINADLLNRYGNLDITIKNKVDEHLPQNLKLLLVEHNNLKIAAEEKEKNRLNLRK